MKGFDGITRIVAPVGVGREQPRPRDRVLLVLLILTWAITWPVVKVGVSTVPAIWFACYRYSIAAFCSLAVIALKRKLAIPPRADWPLIAVSGALQMATYSALTGLALTILPPGRASILAFSTPIWVVPLAAWRLRERATRSRLVGVGAGLAGVLVISAPSLHAEVKLQMIAYGMLLSAAAVWAFSIVFVRAHRFSASPLALAPWQMLVAVVLLFPLACLVEGAPAPLAPGSAASLSFVGPMATAFAYWAVVDIGRRFPASTVSIALLATPCLGILISAATLHEQIGASLLAGGALIAVGIRLATTVSS
jgi:O-acetylserine/cysteine efflux transporter